MTSLTELEALNARLRQADGATATWLSFSGDMRRLHILLDGSEQDDDAARAFELRCIDCQLVAAQPVWFGARIRACLLEDLVVLEDPDAQFRVVARDVLFDEA